METCTRSLPREIRTDRLVLRAANADDATEQVAAITASWPELRVWLPWNDTLPTLQDARRTLQEAAVAFDEGAEFHWIIRKADTEEFVGRVSVLRINWDVPKGEIGYWLDTVHTGHGYIREAVAGVVDAMRSQSFRRAEICCDSKNERSAAVARDLGFDQDALLVNHMVSPIDRTELRDTLIFSRTW